MPTREAARWSSDALLDDFWERLEEVEESLRARASSLGEPISEECGVRRAELDGVLCWDARCR